MGTHLPSQKEHNPQFLARVCSGQMAEWIKMSLGTEVGLGQRTYTSFGYGAQCACGAAD